MAYDEEGMNSMVNFNDKVWVREEFERLVNQNAKYEKALKVFKQYAQECYRKKEAPMAWRIADMAHEALKE